MKALRAAILACTTLLMAACGATATNSPNFAPTSVSTPFEALVSDVNEPGIPSQQIPTPITEDIIAEADAEHTLLANLYERLSPSVVNIEVVVGDNSQIPILDVGNGSGFVYDSDGHIVTNAHVINDAQEIRVTFNDGFVAEAETIGLDTYSDLAVIRVDIDPERLITVQIGDSDRLRVGDRAVVIGNPFGLASSMTTGIVSALGRQLPSAQLIDATVGGGFNNPSIIQVDAEINPGNSGGPLLNSQGEVMGVTTAIRTESGVFEGVGFAVPSRTLMRVVPELIENGEVNYAWLGISAMSANEGFGVAALAEELDLPVTAGVLVSTITPDSPADKAGLLGGTRLTEIRSRQVCAGGDIIVAVDEQTVNTMDELVAYLVMNTSPGDTISMRIIRGRETFDIPLTLESRPETVDLRECGEE